MSHDRHASSVFLSLQLHSLLSMITPPAPDHRAAPYFLTYATLLRNYTLNTPLCKLANPP